MNGALRHEREDALRADVARLVQAMHHHLPARDVPPEIEPLLAPMRHLAALLDADAPAEPRRTGWRTSPFRRPARRPPDAGITPR